MGEAAGHWFEKGICRRIGEGADTRFWQEDWHGGGLFSELFPNLFFISAQQMCRVAEMGMWTENNWHWDLKWSEEIMGNILSQRNELLRMIITVQLVRGKSDSWRWKYEGNEIYSVSSAYEKLMDFDLSDMDTNFTTLWSTLAPSNALVMCWRVFIDRIQSKVNLIARNIPLASSLCSLCLIQEENTNHLFIFCPFAWRVWALTLRWLGWLFVPPALARDHFQQFIGVGSGSMKKGLAIIWVAVIWQIWISRNGLIFRQEHSTLEQVFDQARNKAWLWLKAKHRRFHHTISDWLGESIACCAVL
ncbi:uncharacterized protein LOC130718124 [Lotus japonicus]|uniref:uncharacterized protein LOC130718124 n=1 Tax=Lotus japonicus TaxID=34305 RepID=UPI002590EF7A|nr:uncharacterized protein LOC130718124 [Lotus japonicus]